MKILSMISHISRSGLLDSQKQKRMAPSWVHHQYLHEAVATCPELAKMRLVGWSVNGEVLVVGDEPLEGLEVNHLGLLDGCCHRLVGLVWGIHEQEALSLCWF